VVRLLLERGASLALRDRTERVVHEVVPDTVRGEASWLIDAGKKAAKARGVPAAPQSPLAAQSLMDALLLE
jgi:hypothetical protein